MRISTTSDLIEGIVPRAVEGIWGESAVFYIALSFLFVFLFLFIPRGEVYFLPKDVITSVWFPGNVVKYLALLLILIYPVGVRSWDETCFNSANAHFDVVELNDAARESIHSEEWGQSHIPRPSVFYELCWDGQINRCQRDPFFCINLGLNRTFWWMTFQQWERALASPAHSKYPHRDT